MTYAAVDLTTPWLLYWVALIALLIGAPLVAAALWRRRRHERHSREQGLNQDTRLVEDTRLQRRIGAGVIVAAMVVAAVGAVLHVRGLDALRANIAQKYGITHVEDVRQFGQGYIADLTMPDGEVLRDEMVLLDPDGEPQIGDDIYVDVSGGG